MIIAGGARPKKLGVPGEQEFQNRGVFNCALCDGVQFLDRVVAVCGGGDTGVTEALYLTKLASKVILMEAEPVLNASAILQERASANPKLEIHCGVKVEAIIGRSRVEAIQFLEAESRERGILEIDGLLVHVGLEANTDYLDHILAGVGCHQR